MGEQASLVAAVGRADRRARNVGRRSGAGNAGKFVAPPVLARPAIAVLDERRAVRAGALLFADDPMPLPKPIVIGNWKMNGLRADAVARVEALRARSASRRRRGHARHLPAGDAARRASSICSWHGAMLARRRRTARASPTARTPATSARAMLKDAGCQTVIVGHSERRHGHGESDALVRAKARGGARRRADADPVHRRDRGASGAPARRSRVLDRQLDGSLPQGAAADDLIIAYEPVWAIGTGRTPSARGHRAHPRSSARRSRCRRADRAALRRLGQGQERRRDPGARRRRRRAGRRRQP